MLFGSFVSGHIRPLCLLAVKVACAKPIVITILVSNLDNVYAKINAEVARCRQVEGVLKGAVRCVVVYRVPYPFTNKSTSLDCRVAAVGTHTDNPLQGLVSDIASFERVWNDLVAGSGIVCSSSGATLPPAPPPSLLLLDVSSLRMPSLLHATYNTHSAGVPVCMARRRPFISIPSPRISMGRLVHRGVPSHIGTRITWRHRRYPTFVRRRHLGGRWISSDRGRCGGQWDRGPPARNAGNV